MGKLNSLNTLAPGQSGSIDLSALVGEHIAELARRGKIKLTAEIGPQRETEPDHFEQDITVFVDGKPHTRGVISYTSQPHTWLQRLFWRWVRHKNKPNLEIGVDA